MNELAGHALIAERRYMTVMPSRKRAEDKRAQHKQPEQPHPEQTHVDHLAPRLTDRFRQLERALEAGLEDTFPASDAIAAVQPAPLGTPLARRLSDLVTWERGSIGSRSTRRN